MIVVGIDPHKKSHTAVAVSGVTGEGFGQLTTRATDSGHRRLVRWALALGDEVRLALEDVRHVSGRLERALLESGIAVAPEMVAIPGCGPLTAAKVLAEVAGIERFEDSAKLARYAGVAPVPVSSGPRQRHRLDRTGNRQLNCALQRIATTQARIHPPAREYLARRVAEGKTDREARRCLKRHLVNVIFRAPDRRERSSPAGGRPSLAAALT